MSDLVTWLKRRDAQLRQAMLEELELMMVEGKIYHQNVVRTWTNKPKWKIHSTRDRHGLGVSLEVIGDAREIFVYVDKGTGSHAGGAPYWIFPRSPGGKLRFRGGYQPKTQPVAKANVGPGIATGDWVTSDGVLHPGIKGREFSQTYIDKVLLPTFQKRIVKRVRQT